MAVMEHTIAERPLREIIAAIRVTVQAQDEAALQSLLVELGDLADRIAESADVRAIAVERDRLDRIARAMRSGLDEQAPTTNYILGYFADADRRLDRARTRALGHQRLERHEREARGVREKVLALMAEPRRPRDIADELRCDPSQISRALRELKADGSVVEVPAPAGAEDDRRAHWYAQAQLAVLAA
jgi:Mn-dependent DtxR family transcriptional regulator